MPRSDVLDRYLGMAVTAEQQQDPDRNNACRGHDLTWQRDKLGQLLVRGAPSRCVHLRLTGIAKTAPFQPLRAAAPPSSTHRTPVRTLSSRASFVRPVAR